MTEEQLKSFLNWKSNLKTVEYSWGVLYDIPGYYKYLRESELTDYWERNINLKIITTNKIL